MELSSFFNSIRTDGIGDRIYKAEDWASYFASFIGNGVFPAPSNGLQVVQNVEGGMSVIVRTGKAWINGYFYRNTGDLVIPLQNADGVLKRIDRIVVRWDLTERTITARVKSSALATNPVAPALQRDADAYELCLGDVLVNAGATTITQANITDYRYNTALCSIVIGVIEQIDPSSITAQFDTFFDQYVQLVEAQYARYNVTMSGHTMDAQETYDAFLADLNTFKEGTYEAVGEWFTPFKAGVESEINAWFEDYTSTLGPDEAVQLFNKLYNHEQATVATKEAGVHGIRFKDNQLQILVAGGWISLAAVILGFSWAYRDALNLTWQEWDLLNYTWQEFENLLEKEEA